MTRKKTTEKKSLSVVIQRPYRALAGCSNSRLGRGYSRGGEQSPEKLNNELSIIILSQME